MQILIWKKGIGKSARVLKVINTWCNNNCSRNSYSETAHPMKRVHVLMEQRSQNIYRLKRSSRHQSINSQHGKLCRADGSWPNFWSNHDKRLDGCYCSPDPGIELQDQGPGDVSPSSKCLLARGWEQGQRNCNTQKRAAKEYAKAEKIPLLWLVFQSKKNQWAFLKAANLSKREILACQRL